MKLPIQINETVTLTDIILKYTLRDIFLGILRNVPGTIGAGLRMAIYPLFLKSCGRGFTVKEFVVIKFPERVNIGKHVSLGEFSFLGGDGGITIGDHTRIGPSVVIVSFDRRFRDHTKTIKEQGKILREVTIGEDVMIASNATLLAGIRVGKGAVIGAGAVVHKDVPERAIVAGNPARIIGKR